MINHQVSDDIRISNSLTLFSEFFNVNSKTFWLEAGTALGAFRENRIFPWDHDLDLACWFSDFNGNFEVFDQLKCRGYKIIYQKNFDFIDNIVQFRSDNHHYCDVDLYLYKRDRDFAYMRWIHQPVGFLASEKKYLLHALAKVSNYEFTFYCAGLIRRLLKNIYNIYFFIYFYTSSCRYHVIPASFFLNLVEISFYGVTVRLPAETDSYLRWRYGDDYREPDPDFNRKGRWKAVPARPVMKLCKYSAPDKFLNNQK